jgi:hypothetical protein
MFLLDNFDLILMELIIGIHLLFLLFLENAYRYQVKQISALKINVQKGIDKYDLICLPSCKTVVANDNYNKGLIALCFSLRSLYLRSFQVSNVI